MVPHFHPPLAGILFVTVTLQFSCAVMTEPSFENFLVLVTGWIFASRRTVTRLIVAAGAVGQKHRSAYHRLFATARWSRDQLGLAVFDVLKPWLGEVIFLGLDDTLARKRGMKMFGTGMHHGPARKVSGFHPGAPHWAVLSFHWRRRRYSPGKRLSSALPRLLSFPPPECVARNRTARRYQPSRFSHSWRSPTCTSAIS